MKLNFWQTIGLIVIVIAGVLIVLEKMSGSKTTQTPPATQTAP